MSIVSVQIFRLKKESNAMKELSDNQMKKLHDVYLDLLMFFKNFCQKNGLTFFLGYGSCLGAVREKGFIPWDDDVDIIMPPKDYVRLLKLWPANTAHGKYTLCDTTDKYCDRHMAISIRNNDTTYITNGDRDIDTHHGIMIEIVPYSPCPESSVARLMQTFWACIYAIFRTQRVPNSGGKMQRKAVGLVLKAVKSQNARYKLWRHAEKKILNLKQKNFESVRIFGQFHTLKRFYKKTIFQSVRWLPFENTEMPVPVGYDMYLKELYGDYMTPPPVSQRTSAHDVYFIDTEKSYKAYKGVKYMEKYDYEGEMQKIKPADPELRKVQFACLEILKKYRDVCEKHGLRYYLAYGTLLGAIRHKGYIPWDDDIDVWMPRKDFEIFLKVAETEIKPYIVNYYSFDNNAAFKYRTQLCIEDASFKVGFKLGNGIKEGNIWIDIMSMDGMPSSRLHRKIQCKKFSFWYAVIGLARSSRIGASNLDTKKGFKKFAASLNNRLRLGRFINIVKAFDCFKKTKMQFDYDKCKYVHGSSSFYTEKAVFLREWFETPRYAEFEGERFAVPSEAEKILASIYGDYRKLPPVNNRHRSHFSDLHTKGE